MTTHIGRSGMLAGFSFKCPPSLSDSGGLVIVSMCITAMISDLHLFIRHGRDEDSLPLGKNYCDSRTGRYLRQIKFDE